MRKRVREKRTKRNDLEYTEWLYKEECEYNAELTKLLEKCLPHISDVELKAEMVRVIKASNV